MDVDLLVFVVFPLCLYLTPHWRLTHTINMSELFMKKRGFCAFPASGGFLSAEPTNRAQQAYRRL